MHKLMVEKRDYVSFNNLKQTLTWNYLLNSRINLTFNNNNKIKQFIIKKKKILRSFFLICLIFILVPNSNTKKYNIFIFLIEIGHKTAT